MAVRRPLGDAAPDAACTGGEDGRPLLEVPDRDLLHDDAADAGSHDCFGYGGGHPRSAQATCEATKPISRTSVTAQLGFRCCSD